MDIKDLEGKITNADCMDILMQLPDKCIDLVLTDPPYSSTTAVYNEERAFGHWDNMESDKRLFNLLSKLTERNIKWGLSNVFTCRGKVNKHLIEWCNNNNLTYSAFGKELQSFFNGQQR